MRETISGIFAAIGAAVTSTLLGGWDAALEILLIFVVLDYVTGLAAAFKTKTVKSSVGFIGLLKKASIFVIVILAAQLDRILGTGGVVFRSAATLFFCCNEGLSVMENVGELGVQLPNFLKNALMKLRDSNSTHQANDTTDKEDFYHDN